MTTATTSKPVCPVDVNGLPLDLGAPVLIGQNRYYHHDGSFESHNGFEPTRADPPSDYIRVCLNKLAYHRAKYRLAENVLRQLRTVLRPGSSWQFKWDAQEIKYFGRPQPTPEAAEARMALVTEWHAKKVAVLETRLSERHIDPEAFDL